ncbi:MAG: trypsin-like peptidase domain-containing protein [Planctomycetes bacterium]|nr:trypsin-like peptidase domain-containing protein [Planctomycetota bacterium]
MRLSKFALVLTFLVFGGAARAQDEPDLRKAAFALEKAMEKLIEQNEASIACVLVSRSELYQEFGQGPDKDRPGKLGSFDVAAFRAHARFFGLTEAKQKQYPKLLDFNNPAYLPRAFGSGVVIDAEGLILTNYHVVQDATKIFVRLPGGKSSYADIHAADPRSDLAVLKLLNSTVLPLKAITLGDADKLKRGHFVLTLANPFAVGFRDGQPSASYGILSNIRRRAASTLKEEDRVKPFQYYATLLQTDTHVQQGSSGGAVLNLSGEMVGLITSVAALQGVDAPGGFAIPVNSAVRRIIDVLKRGEEVDYGFLGVAFENANDKRGAKLTSVGPGSPADVDGRLKRDDVLLAVNDHAISEGDDIYTSIGIHLAGEKVKLHVRRGAEEFDAHVTLAKLHVPGKRIVSSLGARPYFRGMRVDYTSLLAQQSPGYTPKGVMISDVQPKTNADVANLKTGDVVTHVNGTAVTSPKTFYQAVANLQGPIDLTLHNLPQMNPPVVVRLK